MEYKIVVKHTMDMLSVDYLDNENEKFGWELISVTYVVNDNADPANGRFVYHFKRPRDWNPYEPKR